MSPNAELAGQTLGHLVALGVRDFVVCAGARNAPLVVSLLDVAAEEGLHVFHHFDERCASFFALGLAKASGKPAAVLTTSGTAVAELHGAMIEAYYTGIPLVAVTADRPAVFRGSGAPQAIEQAGIFGPYAPVALDVQNADELRAVAAWSGREPLHINVCLEEPTAKCRVNALPKISLSPLPEPTWSDSEQDWQQFVSCRDGLVVILGELPQEWRCDLEKWLADLGVPIWAEATSGLRESKDLASWLQAEKDFAVEGVKKVLRFGGVPSLRFWRDLESRDEIEVLSITRRPFSGLARESRMWVGKELSLLPAPGGEPVDCRASSGKLGDVLEKHPRSEAAMVRALSAWIPAEACIFLGNSLPIREWNLAASRVIAHPNCYANRGANGIDGEIATFLGLSEWAEESWGIFGDLTALYDLNAPALLGQFNAGKRRIVILNNGGGKIFSRLPSMAALSGGEKEVTENQHQTRFRSWAEMWGMKYFAWSAGDLPPQLSDSGDSAVVIEVLLDNQASEAFWEAWA